MAQESILSYYYIEGENIAGDYIFDYAPVAMTESQAKHYAKSILEECGKGHLDVYYSETDEFAFDVEI